MDNLVNLLAIMPNGLWEKLIIIFNNAFLNFALSIVILTICIKLVTLPLDFFNRYVSNKNAIQQQELAPEIARIQKRCKGNKQKENEEMAKLYKQKHINPIGSCLFMLLNLALTLTIFITLLNGLNAMSSYRIQIQYEELQIAYVNEYVTEYKGADIYSIIEENNKKSDDDETKLSIYEIVSPYIAEINAIEDETVKTTIIENANKNVSKKYNEVKDGFLWIDNIWLSDTPFYSSIPSFDQYAGVARLTEEEKSNEAVKNTYNSIMDPLRETNGRANGFFILTILTFVTSFLVQWLSTRKQRKQMKDGQVPAMGSGKFMLWFMPTFMAFFSLMYTSMFSIYLVTSQLFGLATMPLMNWIIKKINQHNENKKKNNSPTNPRRV